ncbi:hypothetical protein H1D32_11975 [Anaerobacillus sp. CMMVII]|uniref:hypothetical protein n=1 Tax=Anaerobacillus sp. CMMVII TaxID=2755588 RepID=UPI0021B802C0|nr:hypothetical protein [Anaerobacillus sp. CMMVII]MCT8138403.1 hypothetical protein [Anaerobacillus sp. CMMVII]
MNGNPSPFEHWNWELASINSTLKKTGNMHFKMLGDLINHIPNQVSVLNENSRDEEKEMIKNRILFLNQILSEIETDLDEDPMLWYQEISNVNSKTSKFVEEQLKTVVNY